MARVDRRSFLLASGALVSGCRLFPFSRTIPPHEIIVIGAGLAGLSCALDLKRYGHHVTLLEATALSGGRVLTVNDFRGGTRVEAGGEIFTDGDIAMRAWINELALPAIRVEREEGVQVEGQFLTPETDDPVAQMAWAIWMSLAQRAIEVPTDQLDHISLLGLLEAWRTPVEAIDVINLIAAPVFGATIDSVSAIHAIEHSSRLTEPKFTLRLGMTALVDAMTNLLADEIQHSSAIVAVEHNDHAVAVTTNTGEMTAGHFAVFAIPPTALGRITFDPPLSWGKQRAIEEITLAPWVRQMIQFTGHPWREGSGSIAEFDLDTPGVKITDWTLGRNRTNGILAVDLCGALGDSMEIDEDRLLEFALGEVDRCWPGAAQDHLFHMTSDWTRHHWIGGGKSVWGPNMRSRQAQRLAEPENRLHFVGEHTQPPFGTMNAALISGRRAVLEIVDSVR